ncbi:uncharacterized protein LOC133735391 [Rosa rugosa]|uniref:uncharacterized protein LOC133735391 n=1 Tax=Rosa rugosa TaxID=74645 RepID=UPI002B403983|nr:uncharacterized protein LOC133735391 [Rosa rugosa]
MPSRGLQQSQPSEPISGQVVPALPPIPPNPTTQIASSSFQPDDPSQLQMAEFQNSIELLQHQTEELHHSLDSHTQNLTQNQAAFQDHISAQLAVLQSTILQSLIPQPHPTSSTTSTVPPSPAITFGSLGPITTTWTGLGLSNPPHLLPQPPQQQGLSTPTHTLSSPPPASNSLIPFSTPPPIFSTITSIPQPSLTPPTSGIPASSSPFTPNRFHHHNPRQLDYHPFRPPKIDLPRFEGHDVVGWLAMAERYLRALQVPPHERVTAMASHFGPGPSMWMNAFEQRNPATTWELFIPEFLEHFGSSSVADLKARLSHLQHTGSVEDFISDFTKLSCRTPEWNDNELLPIFCGGLKSEIRHDVMALDPKSLTQAQRLARCFEAKLSDIRASAPRLQRPYHGSYSQRYPAGTNLFSSSTPNQNTHSHPTTHLSPHNPTPNTLHHNQRAPPSTPFKRLSPIEQKERRAKNLCFNCDEQYSASHVCKKPFLAILEAPSTSVLEEPIEFHDCSANLEDQTTEATDFLPLHAITNSNIGEVMRLMGPSTTYPFGSSSIAVRQPISSIQSSPISWVFRFQAPLP